LADQIRLLPEGARDVFLRSLTARETVELGRDFYGVWAHKHQFPPPGDWQCWFLLGGRGGGKTAAASHWIVQQAALGIGPIRLIGPSDSAIESVMVNGPAGILACSPPDFRPQWQSSKGQGGLLTWPNGVLGLGYSSEAPSRLRGSEGAVDWLDDLTAWSVTKGRRTLDMAIASLRSGNGVAVLTASPEENDLLDYLIETPPPGMVTVNMSLFDNASNLSAKLILYGIQRFKGTPLWNSEVLGVYERASKTSPFHDLPFAVPPIRGDCPPREAFEEVIIAIDPTDSAGPTSDECGLMALGRDRSRHVWVIEDCSDVLEPDAWGDSAIALADRWDADRFVAESNRGLALVTASLNASYRAARLDEGKLGRGAHLEIIGVQSRDGKKVRAGPVRTEYQKGALHHCVGLDKLESQQRTWKPDDAREKHRPRSDDRIDALVIGVTHLAGLNKPGRRRAPRGHFSIPGIM
jgi:phage terminase large subunit-like protein